jgi:hypothetical protein
MSKNDGGNVFPNYERGEALPIGTRQIRPIGGMTLRDYFAAQAICAQADYPANQWEAVMAERLAIRAYQIADAMLKARETSHD